MGSLLASELFRLRHRVMPYVLVGLLVVIVSALYLLLWLVLQVETQEDGTEADGLEEVLALSEVLGNGMDLAYSVAGVMAIILASTLISSEYGWGTIRTILPRSSSREAFLGAKVIVVAGFALLLALAGFIAAFAASAVVSAAADLDRDLGAGFAFDAVAAIARTALALLPYSAFAFMLALLTRSTGAGIGVGLAMFFLDETFAVLFETAGETGEMLADLLIQSNVSAVMNANHPDPSDDFFSAWRGAAVILVYSLVFVGVAIWRFRVRDVQVGG